MVHIILYVVDETHAWLTLVSFCQPLTASTIPLMPPEKTKSEFDGGKHLKENFVSQFSLKSFPPFCTCAHSILNHKMWVQMMSQVYQWDGHGPRKHGGATSKGVGQSSLNHSTLVCVCVCVCVSLTILVSPSPVSASDHTSSGKDTAHCHSLRLLPATHPPPVVQTNEYTAVFVWKICVNPLAY